MLKFLALFAILVAPLSHALSNSEYNTAVSNLASYFRDDDTGKEVVSTAVRLGNVL